MRTLDFRAHSADDADHALADEIARALVRRADTRHEGWRNLRQALRQAGAEPPWARCERQAQRLTSERVMLDCAEPGRTSMVRVQHAAAQDSPGPWPRTPTRMTCWRACSTTPRRST